MIFCHIMKAFFPVKILKYGLNPSRINSVGFIDSRVSFEYNITFLWGVVESFFLKKQDIVFKIGCFSLQEPSDIESQRA